MRPRSRLERPLGLMLGTLLGGCALHGAPPLVTECTRPPAHADRGGPALVGEPYGMQATPIPLNSVQFSNWNVAKTVAVQHLFASRTATNTVAVSARFISCTDAPFSIRVRTSFLDANQAPTEPASVWQTVMLQPHATSTYEERSISPRVANYLIEIAPY